MNTKGIKFLAVLAVLVMAFAAIAVVAPAETDDASSSTVTGLEWSSTSYKITWTTATNPDAIIENPTSTVLESGKIYYFSNNASLTMPAVTADSAPILILVEVGTQITIKGTADSTAKIWASYVNVVRTTDTGKVIYTTVKDALGTAWYDSTSIQTGQTYEECTYAEYGRCTGWAAAETTSYTLIALNTGMIYGSSEGGNTNVTSTAITLSGESTLTWTNAQTAAATWTFDDFTGTIKTNSTPTNAVKLTNFTGVIGIAATTYVGTISKWTAGNAEIVTAATGAKAVLATDVPSGCTLTIDASQFVNIASQVTIKGTITAKGTLNLDDGAAVAVAKGGLVDVTAGALIMTATSDLLVGGTLDAKAAADPITANDQKITVTGGTVYIVNNNTTTDARITYVSGSVYHYNTSTETSSIVTYDAGAFNVGTSETLLEAAIDAGATNIAAGAITITKDHELPSGATFAVTSVTLGDGFDLTINSGTFSGSIIANGTTLVISETNPLKGTMTFSYGSVSVNGSITSGDIEVQASGVYYISGSLNGALNITVATDGDAPTDEYPAKVYFNDFTVNSTGVLSIQKQDYTTYRVGDTTDATAKKYFYLYGTIIPNTDGNAVSIEVDKATSETNTFMAFSGAQLSGKVTVEGTGSIDLSQAQNVQMIDQDISADKTYGQLEAVVVIGSLSIKNNSTVTIKGSLTINEGVTLTIESGSKLIVEDSIATVVIDGKMTVEENATLEISESKSVDIAGSLTSSGAVTISATGGTTVKSGGTIEIRDDDGSSITVTGDENGDGLTVAKGGKVTIRGAMNLAPIVNKGDVILNGATLSGAANSTTTVKMAGSGATLEVKSLNGNSANDNITLLVTDEDLKFAKGKVVGEGDYADYTNTVSVTIGITDVFKGLTIVESVTSYDYEGVTYYTNHMDLSGSLIYVDSTSVPEDKTVTVDGKNVEVNDELTIGAGVTLSNAQALAVIGDVYAIASYAGVNNSTIEGTAGSMITVSGEITSIGAIQNAATYVSAAYYTEDVAGVTYHIYTALATAIADGADDIKTYGKVPVSANLEIPTGVVINNSGTISIGSSMNNSVEVLVKDGAIIKGNTGIIDVYGTITFENKKDCKNTVKSDVTVENGDSVTFTSVYLAIAKSKTGDVITITREGTTEIPTSLTIPEGRTLNVPASRVLQLAPGVTLTVNGMLQTAEKITVKDGGSFADKASLADKTAAIKVNGVFRSMADMTYAYYKTSGAYYGFADSSGNYKYVSPVEYAVDTSATTITIYGKVSAGSVDWAGTSSSAKKFTVDGDSELTAVLLDFDYVDFTGTGTFTGIISYGDASVMANEVTGLVTKNKDGSDVVFYLDTVTIPADNENAFFIIEAGDVYAKEIKGDVAIDSDGTLYVANSATTGLAITGDLAVEGTLYIDNGKGAEISGTTQIDGSVVVVPTSEDGTKAAGSLTMQDVFLGITEKEVLGDGASISGPATFDILYAAASATVSDEILEDPEMKCTVFYAEDEIYITAFTKENTYYIDDVEYYIETAKFEGWYNEDGESAKTENAKIGQSGWEEVSAKIDYNVYTLFVRTDNGIKSVAVDGKELINTGNNVFVSHDLIYDLGFYMSAGKYVITFTLKDGYEGTPILYDADGKAVIGGYGITIDGNVLEDEVIVTYQLNGTDPIPTPEPVTPEEQSEWTITTILLVILVILIAVMAVIVALRLNRN